MSESFHADVLIPRTASFSWPSEASASLRRHLPEASVHDGPLFGQRPAHWLIPLQATFGDGYVLSFHPRLGAGTEALALLAEYDPPVTCAGPMAALAGTPGGLIVEVSSDNNKHDLRPDGDQFHEFLLACEAFLGPDGSVKVDYAESSHAWARRPPTLPGSLAVPFPVPAARTPSRSQSRRLIGWGPRTARSS